MPTVTIPIRRRGVLVKVLVRPQAARVTTGPLPAFVDCGASDSVLEPGVVAALHLPPVRSVALQAIGRKDVSFHHTYEVEIALDVPDVSPRWVPLTVLAGAVYQTGGPVALGRDFLAHHVFTYDGPNKRATLTW
jgi:hypothetical protein